MSHAVVDVVIVGGGTIGLATALGLLQQGYNVVLIDKNALQTRSVEAKTPYDARVFAVTRASELLFQQLGIWQHIVTSRYCAYTDMKVWDFELNGQIHFRAHDVYEQNIGYIIEQQVIQNALIRGLTDNPNLQFINHQVTQVTTTADCVRIQVADNQVIEAKLLIAADGAQSQIRDWAHIEVQRSDYQQTSLVATIKATHSHQQTAYQRFKTDGALALLPLSDPHHCSIVWTTTPEQAKILRSIDPLHFNQRLTREIEGVLGELSVVSERYCFDLHTHHAKSYVANRIVLVGDSAHTLHPLAGQGLNLGLLDVTALLNELKKSQLKRKEFGTIETLKSYERARRYHNQMMIWSMALFKQGFTSTNPILQQIRNIGLNWVDRQTRLKKILIKIAMGEMLHEPLT